MISAAVFESDTNKRLNEYLIDIVLRARDPLSNEVILTPTGETISPEEMDVRFTGARYVVDRRTPAEWAQDFDKKSPLAHVTSSGEVGINLAAWTDDVGAFQKEAQQALVQSIAGSTVAPGAHRDAIEAALEKSRAATEAFHEVLRSSSEGTVRNEASALVAVQLASVLRNEALTEDEANRIFSLTVARTWVNAGPRDGQPDVVAPASIGDYLVYRNTRIGMLKSAGQAISTDENLDLNRDEITRFIDIVTVISGWLVPIRGDQFVPRELNERVQDLLIQEYAASLSAEQRYGPGGLTLALRGFELSVRAAGRAETVATWPVDDQVLWAAHQLMHVEARCLLVAGRTSPDKPADIHLRRPTLVLDAIQKGILDGNVLGKGLSTLVVDAAGTTFQEAVNATLPKQPISEVGRWDAPGTRSELAWTAGLKIWEGSRHNSIRSNKLDALYGPNLDMIAVGSILADSNVNLASWQALCAKLAWPKDQAIWTEAIWTAAAGLYRGSYAEVMVQDQASVAGMFIDRIETDESALKAARAWIGGYATAGDGPFRPIAPTDAAKLENAVTALVRCRTDVGVKAALTDLEQKGIDPKGGVSQVNGACGVPPLLLVVLNHRDVPAKRLPFLVPALLRAGLPADCEDVLGRGAVALLVRRAVRKADAPVVAKLVTDLVAAGASASKADQLSLTPLHYAVSDTRAHDAPILKALIAAGADVNARNCIDETPLAHTIRMSHGKERIGGVLRDDNSKSVAATVALLIEAGAQTQDIHGALGDALHVAAASGSIPCIEDLLQNDADATRLNRAGQRPDELATLAKHTEAATLLARAVTRAKNKAGGPRMR